MKNTIIYDIETYPLRATNIMNMSVAVTFDYENQYKVWFEKDIHELIAYLLKFDNIIGFANKNFDNAILNQYLSGTKQKLDAKSIDLLEIIEARLGHRVSLNNIAFPTLKLEKSGDGSMAIDWWLQGKKDLVVEYCKDDVKITKELYEYGLTNNQIYYNSFGEVRKLKIDWNQEGKFKPKDFVYTLTDDETGNETKLDKENKEFFQALELARTTNGIIYLTGKAGTGKTTFLKYLKKNIKKNTIVLAYTGVAAINAGGQTIHSFFQLNPYDPPFLPNDKRLRLKTPKNDFDKTTIFNYFKYNKAKIELIKSLDLLIIDEVSMVRADFIDVIDKLLRAFSGKNRNLPFGGIQVILIGDTFQLPPIEGGEWDILKEFYKSPFFFSSRVFQENLPVYIELVKIYRQNEIEFINLLNRVRVNQPTSEDFILLKDKIKPITNSLFDQNYVVLCSTNRQVNQINALRLKSINGKELTYEGDIEGVFPNGSRITEVSLHLKEGAQIMFIKNGTNYYNGKIGTIEKLTENKIIASTTNNLGEKVIFPIDKSTWMNVKYTFNRKENKIEQEIIGTFKQYPIKLAWAITVHKSQGLTLEKVVISISDFAPAGLVYVALSRCTSLNDLILENQIPKSTIKTDPRVLEFAKNITPNTLIVDMISQGKADSLYFEAREYVKNGNFSNAYNTFLKALKYRNDIETNEFKKYVKIELSKQFHFKALFKKSLREESIKAENISFLNAEKEKLQLEIQHFKNDINQLEIDVKNTVIENEKSQNLALKLRKNKKDLNSKLKTSKQINLDLLNENNELKTEISRLRNLSWFDKLKGNK